MAKLPTPQSHTLLALQEAVLKSRSNTYDSVGISASLAGTECDRALWYTLRWATTEVFTDAAKFGTFDAGNDAEVRLLDDLERIPGVEVVRVGLNGKQIKIYAVGGHVRGKLDAECVGLPEAPATWHVVECKSINDRGFKDVLKSGVEVAKPKHFAQLQIYMHTRGRERGLYLLRHRDSCQTYVERIRYDPVFCERLLDRLRRIVDSPDAPSRIAEDPTKFPCVLCSHREVCHGSAFARVNCRTCLNSTPSDRGGTDANWRCEKTGWDLDLDAQRRGCRMHRFIPAFVPGEQVDVDPEGETVTYRLKSGAAWIDGGAQ